MKNEEMRDSNKLIAEFMGWKLVTVGYFGYEDETQWQIENAEWMEEVNIDQTGDYYVNVPANKWEYADVHYHSSWEDLMPVVDKIEAIKTEQFFGFSVKIQRNWCMIMCHQKNKQFGVIYQTPYGLEPASKLDAVYEAVVFFAKWYNEQKTNTNETS